MKYSESGDICHFMTEFVLLKLSAEYVALHRQRVTSQTAGCQATFELTKDNQRYSMGYQSNHVT